MTFDELYIDNLSDERFEAQTEERATDEEKEEWERMNREWNEQVYIKGLALDGSVPF